MPRKNRISTNTASDGFAEGTSAAQVCEATLNIAERITPCRPSDLIQEVEPDKRTYKVAIVGKAPSSLGLAPYMDTSWSIWGLSDLWRHMPRPVNESDRWFELHDVTTGRKGDKTINRTQWPPDYFDWLKQNQERVPIYLGHRLRVHRDAIAEMTLDEVRQLDAETKPCKWLPQAKMFPVYEFLHKFGTYINNSISFMIGKAIMDGATTIHVYGVDMAQSDPLTGQNGEYEHQRPSCEYMLGYAKGAGIEVHIPGEADLLKCKRIYAFETHGNESDEDKKYRARLKELDNRIAQANAQIQQAQASMLSCSGAKDQLLYDRRRSR